MNRLTLREWMPILPWPPWPLAGHAEFGQNVVVGSMFVLRVALGNIPRGVCLDPHLHCKRTIPRLSVELPVMALECQYPFLLPMASRNFLVACYSEALFMQVTAPPRSRLVMCRAWTASTGGPGGHLC